MGTRKEGGEGIKTRVDEGGTSVSRQEGFIHRDIAVPLTLDQLLQTRWRPGGLLSQPSWTCSIQSR